MESAKTDSTKMDSTKTEARLRKIESLGAMRSETDEVLQELVDDTRAVLRADICIVHLMLTDTLYFRAWSGELPEHLTESRVIEEKNSVCPAVVRSEEPLIVEDMPASRDYRSHPVTTDGGLDFYAGVPLKSSTGEVIGTLCIFCIEPMEFDERDRTTLSVFSKAIMARLELLGVLEGERRARREEQEKSLELQRVLDNSLDIIVSIGFDGEIRSINHASEVILGYRPEELIGTPSSEMIHPDDLEACQEMILQMGLGRPVTNFECRYFKRGGGVAWMEWSATALPDQNLYHCVARDITARREAEQKARETETLYRALVERNPAVIYLQDVDENGVSTEMSYISPRIEEVLGYTPEEWLSDPVFWATRIHPEDRQRVLDADDATDASGDDFKVEYRSYTRSGELVWISDEASLVRSDSGRPLYWLGVQYDVTGLKNIEADLRRTEQEYRSIFENTVEGIYRLDLEGRYIAANPALARILGFDSTEQMLTESPELCSHFSEKGDDLGIILRMLSAEDQVSDYEMQIRKRDGSLIWISGNVQRLYSPEKELVGYEGNLEDITERRVLEEARRESEARFRLLFEQSVEALFIHDERGKIYDCNTEAHRSLGYTRSELMSLNMSDLIIPSGENPGTGSGGVWERTISRETDDSSGLFRNAHRRRDGSTFPVEVRVGPVEYGGRTLVFASVRDVTESRAYERRLTHAASHDPLTELPNRMLFMRQLEESLAKDGDTALLYLDLDGFKAVNDSFGHHIGDALLVQVARRLRSHLREGDTAARLGGDEFTVIINAITEPDHARKVSARVGSIFDSPFEVQGVEIQMGCSIGLACTSGGSASPEELLMRADRMMYRDKRDEVSSGDLSPGESVSGGFTVAGDLD